MGDGERNKPVSVDPVRVRQAQSGDVSYANEVVHETRRKRVTVVPFFIDRSKGKSVSFKIQTHERKKGDDGVFSWIFAEEKSLNLNEEAARKTVAAMQRHLRVGEENADEGDFIVIKVREGVADVADIDPSTMARAVADILKEKDIVEHLANLDLGPELESALRGAMRLRELRDALATLREMLESGVKLESHYQRWCAKHAWAFGTSTLDPDDVRAISAGDTVDFLVPSSLTGLRDLIELKRPDVDVLRYDKSHKSYFWSSEASKALGQCHRYLDALHDNARRGLPDYDGVIAYHPRATIVIGRSEGWSSARNEALHGLNARLSGMTLMTYDQLLRQGEQLVRALAPEDETEDEDEDWPPF